MHDIVTLGGLLLGAGWIVGILTIALGLSYGLTNMMADSSVGDDEKSSCIILFGALLFSACLIGIVA